MNKHVEHLMGLFKQITALSIDFEQYAKDNCPELNLTLRVNSNVHEVFEEEVRTQALLEELAEKRSAIQKLIDEYNDKINDDQLYLRLKLVEDDEEDEEEWYSSSWCTF